MQTTKANFHYLPNNKGKFTTAATSSKKCENAKNCVLV